MKQCFANILQNVWLFKKKNNVALLPNRNSSCFFSIFTSFYHQCDPNLHWCITWWNCTGHFTWSTSVPGTNVVAGFLSIFFNQSVGFDPVNCSFKVYFPVLFCFRCFSVNPRQQPKFLQCENQIRFPDQQRFEILKIQPVWHQNPFPRSNSPKGPVFSLPAPLCARLHCDWLICYLC